MWRKKKNNSTLNILAWETKWVAYASEKLSEYFSSLFDTEAKDVGNRISHRQKDLLSFPKLSLCTVNGSLVLKNKCIIFENMVYSLPTLCNFIGKHSMHL